MCTISTRSLGYKRAVSSHSILLMSAVNMKVACAFRLIVSNPIWVLGLLHKTLSPGPLNLNPIGFKGYVFQLNCRLRFKIIYLKP